MTSKELDYIIQKGAGMKPGGTTQETGMTTEEAILLLLREDP